MQALRPFPQFNDRLGVRWAPLGNNWYDSLQVKVTKRYSQGLDLTAAYTFQKELVLGNGGNPGLGGPTVNNPFNRKAQKSLANTSQPHIFVTASVTTRRAVGRMSSSNKSSAIGRLADWCASPAAH